MQNFNLHGKIENSSASKVSFVISRNGLIGDKDIIELELAKDGRFELSIQLEDIAYLDFWEGERGIFAFQNFVIEPDDNITMVYDSKNPWKTILFTGKSADKYKYFVEDYVTFKYKSRWNERFDKRNNQSIEEQFAYIDSIENSKLLLLSKYKNHISPSAYLICEADLKAEVNSNRFMCIDHQREIDSSYSLLTMPRELKKFLYRMPNQNDTTAKSIFYLAYLDALARQLFRDIKSISKVNEESQWITFQKSIYSRKIAQYQLGFDVYYQIRSNGINPTTTKLLEAYRNAYPDSPYLPILEGRYIKSVSLSNGQKAISFVVQDEKGNKVKLEDFKGKVVFIDFWASWCVACINEMKNFKKIREQFKDNKNFIYLTISMDEKEENWHKSLEKWQVEGVKCWAKGAYTSDIAKNYQIGALPVFILIGKDGKFLDVNPPRPRFEKGKTLTNLLHQALAQ
ncbi:MAG: TlpA disulfide reductase family protein [Spirosomataceae bacterium]